MLEAAIEIGLNSVLCFLAWWGSCCSGTPAWILGRLCQPFAIFCQHELCIFSGSYWGRLAWSRKHVDERRACKSSLVSLLKHHQSCCIRLCPFIAQTWRRPASGHVSLSVDRFIVFLWMNLEYPSAKMALCQCRWMLGRGHFSLKDTK